jgi:hypothetical protein
MSRKSPCLPLLLILGAMLCAIPVHGCSVPVFRYALEHWTAAPFQAFVFHRGPLTDAQQAAARDLGQDGLAGKLHANVSVRTVDLNEDPAPELIESSGGTAGTPLPWLVVRFPASNRRSAVIWSGPLSTVGVAQLLDSPARKEMVRRITEGESAVWVLLESGDAAKDAAAAELIEGRLKYLESVLELPKLDAQDIANGLVSVGQEGLRLGFSLLRLSRDDPRERPFIQMLLGSEADLEEMNSPIVFPIFGQGRALYALAGGGIGQETIDKAATFLIGKCSCEVKELNPGVDLLLAADWKVIVESQAAGIPDLPTMADLTKSAPVTVTISGHRAAKVSGDSSPVGTRSPIGIWAIIGAIAVAALLVARLVARRGN